MQLSESLLRELFEFAPDAILVVDRAGQIVNCNAQAETLFGYQRDELVGRVVETLIPERFLAQHTHHREAYLATPLRRPMGSMGTLWGRRKDDHEIPLDIMLNVLNDSGLAIATIRDISERYRAEKQIEEQLARLKSLRAIDLAILNTTDLRIVLNTILEETHSRLHTDAASIHLLNPYTLLLEPTARIGYRSAKVENAPIRLGDGLAGKAALERRIIALPHVEGERPSNVGYISAGLIAVWRAEGAQTIYAAPLIAKGQVIGTHTVLFRTAFHADQDWLDFFEALVGQTAMAIDSVLSFESLQRANFDLMLAYNATIEGWSRALDLRDHETEGHTLRVTEMTLKLGRLMGMAEADLVHVKRGALLHDLGKMGIPDAILLKPDKLTDEEWAIMRKHPQYVNDFLLPIAYLRPALDIPYCHHEKWDGSGYPRGLKGEEIPLSARVFAVADVYDALRSDRPYRKAWTEDNVLEYIRSQAGMHFDPQVTGVFMQLF